MLNFKIIIAGIIMVSTSILLSVGNRLTNKEPNQSVTLQDLNPGNEAFNKILSQYVDQNGKVNYTKLKESPFILAPFIEFIEKISPLSHPQNFPTENDKKAYWINAYNGLMIQAVIDNPDILSVKEIGWLYGVFWRKKFTVGGKQMTLNHIEHKILRGEYKDPRIHFAINCASNSCPTIGNRIVIGLNLDRQLDDKARGFIGDSTNVIINHETKTILLSRIFKWYRRDFEKEGHSLISYLKMYRNDLPDDYSIKYLKYDWGLNDQAPVEK